MDYDRQTSNTKPQMPMGVSLSVSPDGQTNFIYATSLGQDEVCYKHTSAKILLWAQPPSYRELVS